MIDAAKSPRSPGSTGCEIRLPWFARLLLVLLACASAGWGLAAEPVSQSAATMQAKYAALGERLRHNQFQQALYLDSTETSGSLAGDLYAVVDYPFATVSSALSRPGQWCEVLILNLNTKYCRAAAGASGSVLTVDFGRKYAQPLEDAYPIEFAYQLATAAPDHLEIRLDADKGPLSTTDYRIRLAAVPVDGSRTFLHLTYSYGYGLTGRLAMQTYLATIGRDKVGFTITGRQADGQPEYIGGLRGVVERNTMRYYLAIDAYLGSLTAPPRDQFEKRMKRWFAATERYPRQLHEVAGADYYAMKRSEYQRQQQPLYQGGIR